MNIPQSKCTLIGHTSSITTMTKINNETIASGGNDNKIIIWDINLKKVDNILYEGKFPIIALLHLKDERIVSSSQDRAIRIFSLKDNNIEIEISVNSNIRSIAEMPDGKMITGMDNGDLIIWDMNENNKINTIHAHNKYITQLLVLNNEKFMSGSKDSTMIVWNINDIAGKVVLKEHKNGITGLVKIGDKRFVSSAMDGRIKLWE